MLRGGNLSQLDFAWLKYFSISNVFDDFNRLSFQFSFGLTMFCVKDEILCEGRDTLAEVFAGRRID